MGCCDAEETSLGAQVWAVPLALTSYPSPLTAIFHKDLLATLHLLVALAERFQPNLPLPADVQVEVITMEVRAGHGGPSLRQLLGWTLPYPGLRGAAWAGAEPQQIADPTRTAVGTGLEP